MMFKNYILVLFLIIPISSECSYNNSKMVKSEESMKSINMIKFYTKNNVKVLFNKSNDVAIVDIDISIDAGSVRDGEKYGLAMMASEMLMAGTKSYDENQIIDNLSDLGTSLSTGLSKEMASIEFRSMSMDEYFHKSAEYLVDILNNPSFPKKVFDRIKQQSLLSLDMQKQSASDTANKSYLKALYKDSPYGTPTKGTKKSLNSIELQDIIDFYNRYYVANNVVISIVADITEQQAKDLSEKLTEKLKIGIKSTKILQPKALEKSENINIDFDATQTTIITGTLGVEKGNPLFFPLMLGNQILGGSGLTSILFEEVRTKNGLAYGISSSLSTKTTTGLFTISTKTKNDKAQEALLIINKTYKNFIENGVTQKQLDSAKKYLTGSFPIGVSNNIGKLRVMNMIAFYDLPLDYLDTYLLKINKVTVADIKNAYGIVFKNKPMVTVLVGKNI